MTIAAKSFVRRLTGLVAAGSIAIGAMLATSAPAAALGKNERDILRALAAAAAIGFVVKELNDNKKKKARANEYNYPFDDRRDRDLNGNWYDNNYKHDKKHDKKHNERDRWNRKDDARRTIPAQCVQQVRTRNDWRDVVYARCLEREGNARNLPESCAFNIRTERGQRQVYGLNCLRERGFRVARR